MKNILILTCLVVTVLTGSCSKDNNPVKQEDERIITPYSDCSIAGMDIYFEDTCSYHYVMTFLSKFDSVKVNWTSLGSDVYVYADSGDYKYWREYFRNDSTIMYLFDVSTNSDSLKMRIILSGERSIEEELQRINRIGHFQILKTEEQQKIVTVDVPEGTESKWEKTFEQYPFVTEVYIVMICPALN